MPSIFLQMLEYLESDEKKLATEGDEFIQRRKHQCVWFSPVHRTHLRCAHKTSIFSSNANAHGTTPCKVFFEFLGTRRQCGISMSSWIEGCPMSVTRATYWVPPRLILQLWYVLANVGITQNSRDSLSMGARLTSSASKLTHR